MLWSFPETDNTLGICSVFVSGTSSAVSNYPESKSGIEKNSCQFVKLDFQRFVKGANLMSGNFPSWLLIILVIQIACMFDKAIAINVCCHVLGK